MRLPILSFFKKARPSEYFLAMLYQDEMLRAVVFEEKDNNINIIGTGTKSLPAPIDDVSFEELLEASDKAISVAESNLPENVQSHKTIFGVKEDWTHDLQISKDHLITLKKLSEELDLKPIGFLVFAEATAHLLQKEEGAPVSAVLVELGTKHITATLLRAGRIVETKQALLLTENLPKSVDSLLMEFKEVEILPSRIILLDNLKREHLTQTFTKHSWSKQLPFLHVPHITLLPNDFEIQAILYGTATQMGFDMLGLPKMEETPLRPAKRDFEGQAEETEEIKDAKEPEGGESEIEDETKETKPDFSAENLGFVKDKDVLETEPKKPHTFDRQPPEDETLEKYAEESFADIPEEVKEEEEGLRVKPAGLGISAVKLAEGVQKIFSEIKKVKMPAIPKSSEQSAPKRSILLIPIVLLIIIAIIIWYIFGVKARAIIFINPKVVTATQGVTFSSTNGTDISSDTIGGNVSSVSESGSTSTQATGSQDVGDKAKGTITVFNSDSQSHTLQSGTTIISSNGLKFTLDKDVTVASGSSDPTNLSAGTADVSVTASNIGTDYNLPSSTKFSIGENSVIAAKNANAFSGGTKKTVTVVSQKDLDKLTSDLTNNLGNKAKQDAQSNSSSDKTALPVFLSSTMSNQKFDHKLNDQASNVSLNATIAYQALTYNKSDVDKIALAILQSNNPGQDITQNNVSEDLQNPTPSKDGKNINATLSVKAGLLPKIDSESIAQKLAGKSFSQATSILSDVSQLESVQGVLSPNFFFLPKSFPRISSHISVEVRTNE